MFFLSLFFSLRPIVTQRRKGYLSRIRNRRCPRDKTLKEGAMKETLKVGLEHVHTYRVPENKTVPHLYPEAKAFQEMPKVFATGYMVGLMEWACIEAMAPHMEPGEGSVGTLVNVTHTAATPPGMTVTVRVRCIGVEGRRTVWDIEAKDDVEVIGRGTHERFAVDFAKFNARVAKKAAGA
jgi:fluoroacetyl-CoA thioesterase